MSRFRLALVGGTAVAVVVAWRKIALVTTVSKYSVKLFLVDHLPQFMKRRIMSKRFAGEALEQRLQMRLFKGWATIKALWRMSSINLYPRVRVGQSAPHTPVLLLDDNKVINLVEMAHGTRPLVLNFGSCT